MSFRESILCSRPTQGSSARLAGCDSHLESVVPTTEAGVPPLKLQQPPKNTNPIFEKGISRIAKIKFKRQTNEHQFGATKYSNASKIIFVPS